MSVVSREAAVPADSRFKLLTNVIVSPHAAFLALRERPTALFPLGLLILSSVLVTFLYYKTVDFEWFVDHLVQARVASSGSSIPLDQQEKMHAALASVSPTVMGIFSAASAALLMCVVFFGIALYLNIISVLTGDGFKLKNWLSLVSWCALPMLTALLVTLISLFISDRQLAPEHMNPLSFSNLLALDASGAARPNGLLQYTDPTVLWALGLAIVGYRRWTGRSMLTSVLIFLAPVIFVTGISLWTGSSA